MSLFKNRQLLALAFGHFGTDMNTNIMPVLYPLLMVSLGLSYTMVGVLQLVYTIVSSLLQPFFGHLADRHGGRYFAAGGVLTTSICMGLVGFTWDYASLLVLLCISALGVAAFHPQGAMNVAAVTSRERHATAMSIFMLGGSTGFAIGPLLGAAVLSSPFGLRGMALLAIPGVLIAVWLSRLMVGVDQRKRAGVARPVALEAPAVGPRAIGPLVAIIVIVMLRSWAYGSMTNFLPLWYHDRGLSVGLASETLFVMLIAGAAGGLLGGYLADRFGRRRVVALSLFGSSAVLGLFLNSPIVWAWPLAALLGLAFSSSYSVLLVMAQGLLPRGVGVASGLILGLAFVTGGIGTAITGWAADGFGIGVALSLLVPLPLLAGVICVRLPQITPSTASSLTSSSLKPRNFL